jgi:hypothetical protein
MEITLSNIVYNDLLSSNAKLITIPKEGETYEFITQDNIDKQNYTLSTRNGAGTYIIPTEKQKLYLNFVPRKTQIFDDNFAQYIDTGFSYFVPPSIIPPDKFTLAEGQIFRCVSENSTPTNKENYTYYIYLDGKKKKIPNYKTLEVMLAERNQTLLSVRVVSDKECNQIELASEEIPDKEANWTEDFKDVTNSEALKTMEGNVKTGAALAESAKAEASAQIAAVKAAEEKAKAQAEAAKAQSEADKAASQAAIANAQAAQAAAEAAKAQADAAKAQAEASKKI